MNKITFFLKCIITSVLLILQHNAGATTQEFSGTINDSVTWTSDTIKVTGNIIVSSTGVLNIPSVPTEKTIIFQGQYSITVYGKIYARGRVEIIRIGKLLKRTNKYANFTYKLDTTGFSNPAISTVGWNGIKLQSGSIGNFYLCTFQLAKSLTTSLFTNTGKASFENCIFTTNKIFNTGLTAILYSSPSATNDSLYVYGSSFTNNRSSVTLLATKKFKIDNNTIYKNVNTSATNISDESALTISYGTGTISRNKIYDNSKNGVNINWTNSILVERNYIYNNNSNGLKFYNSIVKLQNNLITNNASAGYIDGTITTFINNTIAFNNAGLTFVKPSLSGGADAYFYNTIIWNNNTSLSGNMNIFVYNSILPYNYSTLKGAGFSVKAFINNKNSDPLFKTPTVSKGWDVNAISAYWAPQSSSPCINNATTQLEPNTLPATDYVGTSRIKQGFPDIGAYELLIPVDSITSGTINTATMWVADTVKVFTDVTVVTGGKLTIAPGTVVSFQDNYSLLANGGSIIAKGTKLDSIVFTRQNPVLPISETTGIFWSGINIQTASDSSSFDYCRFEFAEHKGFWKGAAINVDYNDLVTIKNSVFRNNISRSIDDPQSLTGDGAAIAAFNSDIKIDRCIFTDNLGKSAVFINSSNVELSNSYFTRNEFDIYFSYATKPIIINSILRSSIKHSSSNPIYLNCEFYANAPILLFNSNPRFYNSVIFKPIDWSDQSSPTFFNCLYNATNYTALSALTQNPFRASVTFLKSFVWNEGTINSVLTDYKRNSFYPSINNGILVLPSDIVLPTNDIFGNPRVISDAIDIGAIEQTGSAPNVIRQAEGTTLCSGTAYTLSIANSDTAIYVWKKDGVALSNESKSQLNFSSLSESNSGSYWCELINSFGKVISNAAQINVGVAPSILSLPESRFIVPNSPLSLEVPIAGSKPLTISWTKNSVLMPDQTKAEIKTAAFQASNEGNYICNVTNSCGSVTSDTIKLYLVPKLINKNDVQLCAGDTFRLKINFNDFATFQWYKDGVIINSATDSIFIINNIKEADQGNYSCRISNSKNTVSTDAVLLQINKAPEIILQPSAEWVMLNSPLILESKANGTNPITYQWMKDGANVAGGGFNKLNIPVFTNTSQGNYICVVSNICGTAKTDTVKMLLAPIAKTLSNDFLCEGDTFRITTEFNGIANYQWVKDGIDISGANTKTLEIKGISELNMGNYYCRVSNNQQAMLTNTALLQIKSAPDVTLQPEGTLVAQGANPVLEVRADGQKPLKYQWYKDNTAISGDTLPKLKLLGFELSDEGKYYCKINSRCGSTNSDKAGLYMAPQICMVTVDTISGNNLIIWEKPSKLKYAKYNVYREGAAAGYYNILGSVLAKDAGLFEDKTVNPKEQAYLYKITGIDSIGNETDIELCNPHKTIHLLVTEGVPTGFQLDWDEYIGFSYPTYRIFRSTDGKKFTKVHEMASSTRTWTDFNAPSTDLFYFVSVSKLGGCNPSGNARKAGGGIYVQAVSNMEDNRLRSTGVSDNNININILNIYPNPAINKATIKYSVQANSKVAIYLCNSLGAEQKLLLSEAKQMGNYSLDVDINNLKLNAGVYYIKLKADNTVSVKKLVVTK